MGGVTDLHVNDESVKTEPQRRKREMSKTTKSKTQMPAPTPAFDAAKVLLNWREQMGYDQHEASKEVGCTRMDWQLWEASKHPVPRYIRLAMSALSMGMLPYGDFDTEHKD
jgi:hypothetical protein